jgi:osmoprotectant transport system ATP-binding protein
MNRLTKRGVSGIFVTHDISAALAVAHRIAVLKDGKIYAQCTPKEFENTQDPYMQNFLPETKVS